MMLLKFVTDFGISEIISLLALIVAVIVLFMTIGVNKMQKVINEQQNELNKQQKVLNEQQDELNRQQKILNRQQDELNRIALQEKEKEKEAEKQAQIRIEPIEGKHNYMVVKIENHGLCKAENIRIDFLNEILKDEACKNSVMFDGELPKMLEPGKDVELGLHCFITDDFIEYRVAWADGAGEHIEGNLQFKRICSHD